MLLRLEILFKCVASGHFYYFISILVSSTNLFFHLSWFRKSTSMIRPKRNMNYGSTKSPLGQVWERCCLCKLYLNVLPRVDVMLVFSKLIFKSVLRSIFVFGKHVVRLFI